jgi:tetratricopeptide (TPR) repeat protein
VRIRIGSPLRLILLAGLISAWSPYAHAQDPRRAAAEQLFSEGFQLARTGNHAAAADKYELGLRIMPGSAAGHYYYAQSLSAIGRTDDAFAQYQQAAQVGPNTKEGILAAAIVARDGPRRAAEAQQRRIAAAQQAAAQQAWQQQENFRIMRSRLEGTWCDDSYAHFMLQVFFDSNNVLNQVKHLTKGRTFIVDRITLDDTDEPVNGSVEDGAYFAGLPGGNRLRFTPTYSGMEMVNVTADGDEFGGSTQYHRCPPKGE